ncbi:LOW QUALITY PROTEIN: peroxisomal testis-specific protein 1 [Apodemus sylvaticus]|uniref:LOW QUALITY PROTEIN: peroxisomal testis-specific protein 1 n=1 Tax=Apodemus sylvaticus TaxID=10129 RepID=UPI002242E376|nr:LOW QUALITY PROTEIN: peroxisomal testis-specific protein 1 [Apodemus sylvaticus]
MGENNNSSPPNSIVYEPKEVLYPTFKVTNCCMAIGKQTSWEKYVTRLVCQQPSPAMSRNPDHAHAHVRLHTRRGKTALSCRRWFYKFSASLLNRAGPSAPCQPKENAGQNHPQPEEIQTLTMQLRHIGDSVNHRVIQEHLPQEVGDALVPFVARMFLRGQMLLRFFWNNHLL